MIRNSESENRCVISQTKSNYFILVGAPGTGKTTVLNHLRARGAKCYDEAARSILEEQLKINGPALPSNDPLRFCQVMQLKTIEDYENAKAYNEPVIFDRGMPDLVHYAIRFNVNASEFENAAKAHRYNPKVFVFAPWAEIYKNDHVRPLPFEKTIEIHELLLKVYKDLGYEPIPIPQGTVGTRADLILKEVAAFK